MELCGMPVDLSLSPPLIGYLEKKCEEITTEASKGVNREKADGEEERDEVIAYNPSQQRKWWGSVVCCCLLQSKSPKHSLGTLF